MARPKQYADAVSQHLKIERADYDKSAEYAQADGFSWNAWILQLIRKELRRRAKNNMPYSIPYSEIKVGECFQVNLFRGASIYMKISSEIDHNHDYVTISEDGRGNVHPALDDNMQVYPVNINLIA